jgi:hypothetical protein
MAAFDPGHVKGCFPLMRLVAQWLTQRWKLAARQGAGITLQSDGGEAGEPLAGTTAPLGLRMRLRERAL